MIGVILVIASVLLYNHLTKVDYTPEDWQVFDSEPSDIGLIENIKIEYKKCYIELIPQYKDQSTVTLKIINFTGKSKKLKVKINGVEKEIFVSKPYET